MKHQKLCDNLEYFKHKDWEKLKISTWHQRYSLLVKCDYGGKSLLLLITIAVEQDLIRLRRKYGNLSVVPLQSNVQKIEKISELKI